ncbi:hypothetical protein BDV10DRAFT_191158 [Aspergillus recurvatus]
MASGINLIPNHKELERAGAEFAASQLPTPEGTTSSQEDGEDKELTLEQMMKTERERVEEQLRIMAENGGTAEMAIKLLKNMYLRKYHDSTDFDRQLQDITLENQRLEAQVRELDSSNTELFNDAERWQTTVSELRAAMDLAADALPGGARKKAVEVLESFNKLQERERELKEKYDAREVKIALLESQVETARGAIEEYKAKLAVSNQASGEWAEGQQEYTSWLSNENLRLRTQLDEMNAFLAAQRIADFGRWEQLLPQFNRRVQFLQDRPSAFRASRPTCGTVDVDMRDAVEVNTGMESLPDKHETPAEVRMRRRMYKSKTKAKRAGSSSSRAARPVECSKGYSEKRAASTYLQYRDGTGRSGGVSKAYPRKRTRLQKSADMRKRMEAVSKVRRLPALPRSLTVRVAAQAYTRRDDNELAKLMTEKWSISDKEPTVEVKEEENKTTAKVVTITKTVEPFIPRPKTFSGPTYSPKEAKPLSRGERQHWAKMANKWTLGPEKKKIAETAKKHVRFAKKIEYEPDWPAQRACYEPPSGYIFSRSHVIIAILLGLLLVPHATTDRGWGWREANKRPEDIVAKFRVPGPGDARVPVLDFEFGKWSDVHAHVSIPAILQRAGPAHGWARPPTSGLHLAASPLPKFAPGQDGARYTTLTAARKR